MAKKLQRVAGGWVNPDLLPRPKLELGEGRLSGARYWTVHPVVNWELGSDWGNIESWSAQMAWCVDTFGPGPEDGVWTPGARWYANNAKFWFRDEKDRDWFILRWA
jgi:hypothetical protein